MYNRPKSRDSRLRPLFIISYLIILLLYILYFIYPQSCLKFLVVFFSISSSLLHDLPVYGLNNFETLIVTVESLQKHMC